MPASSAPAPAPSAQAHPALTDLHALIDELWPESLAEPWDAVGLTTGDPVRPVRRVLLAVDPVDAVVEEAAARGADLLLTHHPLLLRGVTSIAADTLKGGQLTRLLTSGVAHIAAHTNADAQRGGVSDVLIEALGVHGARPLAPASGAAEGIGIGRWADMPEPATVRELARRLAAVLPATATGVRIAGDGDAEVHRVAVCGGAGDSLFDEVRAVGADVYITSDLRHHPATEARDTAHRRPADTPHLIDISHWAAESLWLDRAAEQLSRAAAVRGWELEIEVSRLRTDVWDERIGQEAAQGRDDERAGRHG
ncbi:Nif3-like dinuclear metal center hexameric protein [Brevibacterium album]|uniref:Nif3-like dinuclear metal center hexameric protein n=1 Tax=Brevibacterium album TaxID=417948 RepID=UPI0003FC5880|nr:Nif3-like dinuclear metal center hexameric protein [Brevibacterium album]